ncbi:MAG: arginine--tRNA ligase [Planctomycetes bacterium]|nr:arginine--tRNA ligase [Planctomycetota bacterium]
MNILKNIVAEKLTENVELEGEQILEFIEIPPNPEMGDLAFPCFKLSKIMRKNPALIAQELVQKLSGKDFEKIEAKGPYINFFFSIRTLAELAFKSVSELEQNDFKVDVFGGKTVTVDYSSPNIAKEFSIGHLRATSLGHCIARMMKLANANVVSINHLGDWGTQFGVLVYAYQQEGDDAVLKDEPILALQTIYRKYSLRMKAEKARMRSRDENADWDVKRALDIDDNEKSDEILAQKLANDEYLGNPRTADDPESVTELARKTFSLLEQGDEEIRTIWQKFRNLSISRLKEIYAEMDIEFDHYHGEAFYEDKMPAMLELIRQKKIMKLDQGAQIIDIGAKKNACNHYKIKRRNNLCYSGHHRSEVPQGQFQF